MTSTGCKELDRYFQYPETLSCIYGKPASGKTTFCLMAAAAEKGKVIFVDTENSFSVERIEQIHGKLPENIFLIKAGSFKEQCSVVENLLKLKGKVSLVIIDSFTSHYRKELQEKRDVNPKMSRQLSILAELAREKIPIVLTSQVYSTLDNKVEPVGSKMLKNWCGCVMRLENEEKRKIIIEKHPSKKEFLTDFEITNSGIKITMP